MALGNWDKLCFDESGNLAPRGLVSPMGVSVYLYKDWVFVDDPRAVEGRQGRLFADGTVMRVKSGHLTYLDVELHVQHCQTVDDRETVLLVAWCPYMDDPVGISGVGTRLHDDRGTRVGVTVEQLMGLFQLWSLAGELTESYCPFNVGKLEFRGGIAFCGREPLLTVPPSSQEQA